MTQNKKKPAKTAAKEPKTASRLDGINAIVAGIKEDLADNDLADSVREKLTGRLLQAERITQQIESDARKLELRLAESPAWIELSRKLVAAIGGCKRCSAGVLKMIQDA